MNESEKEIYDEERKLKDLEEGGVKVFFLLIRFFVDVNFANVKKNLTIFSIDFLTRFEGISYIYNIKNINKTKIFLQISFFRYYLISSSLER